MKYGGMPWGMWVLFRASFEKALIGVLNCDPAEAKRISHDAGARYRQIIEDLPEFEKGDRFKMNIVSCAMYGAICLNMKELPSVEKLTEFYKQGMMTGPMKWFCRRSGKKKFTESDIKGMKATEKFQAADRNPYSWNMEFRPYEDGNGYEARFTSCGICRLLGELGLKDAIPAMCALDYTMSEAGGASEFIREYTLAGGGPYCDCGYRKKGDKT